MIFLLIVTAANAANSANFNATFAHRYLTNVVLGHVGLFYLFLLICFSGFQADFSLTCYILVKM